MAQYGAAPRDLLLPDIVFGRQAAAKAREQWKCALRYSVSCKPTGRVLAPTDSLLYSAFLMQAKLMNKELVRLRRDLRALDNMVQGLVPARPRLAALAQALHANTVPSAWGSLLPLLQHHE